MSVHKAILLCIAAIAFGVGGCMDPSIYHGSGAPSKAPGATSRQAPATPAPKPKVARKGDIRIKAPAPGLLAQSPDNVAITIEKIGTDARSATDASLAFRYANANVVARSPGGRLARRNGIRIAVGNANFRAQLSASHRRSRHSTRESMFITVLSGHEGQILMGSDTWVGRLGYWTPRGYRVLVERAFVGRSLVVRPRILGRGLVEVELWPRFSTRGRRGAIDVTELATKVVVRDGQPIVIGGTATASDDVGTILFGIGKRTRSGTTAMILTPKIGGAAIDWP